MKNIKETKNKQMEEQTNKWIYTRNQNEECLNKQTNY